MKTLTEIKIEGLPIVKTGPEWEECFKKIINILGDLSLKVKWTKEDTEASYIEKYIKNYFKGRWSDLIKINKTVNFDTGKFAEITYSLCVKSGIELLSTMDGFDTWISLNSINEIMNPEHDNWKILENLKRCFPLTIREYK